MNPRLNISLRCFDEVCLKSGRVCEGISGLLLFFIVILGAHCQKFYEASLHAYKTALPEILVNIVAGFDGLPQRRMLWMMYIDLACETAARVKWSYQDSTWPEKAIWRKISGRREIVEALVGLIRRLWPIIEITHSWSAKLERN